MVATDAHAGAGLAWFATGVAAVVLAVGLVVASSTTVQGSVAVLAALFLLRDGDRLLLAPLYGASLLLVGELAQISFELRGMERVGAGVLGSRLGAVLLLAAFGTGAAAVAALAVTVAPARSVGFTAAGTFATVAAFALIVALARRHAGTNSQQDAIGDRRDPSDAGH